MKLLLGLVALGHCQEFVTKHVDGIAYRQFKEAISKEDQDGREYAALELSNRLRVVLVSDAGASKAYGEMLVSTGSRDDPPYMLGMAHLAEHIVANHDKLSCQDEDFVDFVHDNGGSEGAMTEYDSTRYTFNVDPSGLNGTLLHFSKSFRLESLKPGRGEREATVVDYEYLGKRQGSFLAVSGAQSTALDQAHPFSRFSHGSLESLVQNPRSLGKDIDEEIVKFVNLHYSASRMKLVVISSEPLDTLVKYVVPRFSEIAEAQPEPELGSPFKSKTKRVVAQIPKATKSMLLQFRIPLAAEPLSHAVFRFIEQAFENQQNTGRPAKIMGHPWNYASSASFKPYREFSTLTIQVDLDHADVVKRSSFLAEFLALIGKLGETALADAILESNAKRLSNSRLTDKLANGLHWRFPLRDLSTDALALQASSKATVSKILHHLSPENMDVVLVSPCPSEVSCTDAYEVEELAESFFALDQAVPSQPSQEPGNANDLQPVLIKGKLVLFKIDGPGDSPEMELTVQICNTPVFPALFAREKVDSYFRQSKDIASARIEFDIAFTDSCFLAKFKLPRGNLFTLTHHFLESFKAEILEETIQILKQNALDAMADSHRIPFDQVDETMKYILKFDPLEKPTNLVELSPENLLGIAKDFGENMLFVTFVGDLDSSEVARLVEELAGTESVKHPPVSPAKGFRGEFATSSPAESPTDPHSAIEYYLHAFDPQQPRNQTLSLLLNHLVSDCFFYQLRTEEYLGYNVELRNVYWDFGGGLVLAINSRRHPVYLESRINSFLVRQYETLKAMPPATLSKKIASLKKKIQQSQGNDYVYSKDWRTQEGDQYVIDDVVRELDGLKPADVTSFYQMFLLPASPHRAKVSVHVVGREAAQEDTSPLAIEDCGKLITDVDSWKH